MQDERKHLTVREVEKLMAATQGGRNAARDHCLLLLMFRHGLRVSEACGLRLAQIDLESRVIHCAPETRHPDDAATAAGRAARDQSMAATARHGDCAERCVFPERARRRSQPAHGLACGQALWRAGRAAGGGPSPHAAPRLRLCPDRPGRGCLSHPRLSRPPQSRKHVALCRGQSGTVWKTLAQLTGRGRTSPPRPEFG